MRLGRRFAFRFDILKRLKRNFRFQNGKFDFDLFLIRDLVSHQSTRNNLMFRIKLAYLQFRCVLLNQKGADFASHILRRQIVGNLVSCRIFPRAIVSLCDVKLNERMRALIIIGHLAFTHDFNCRRSGRF